MGVKVSQDEGIILDVKKSVELWGETGGAGGGRGNVNVEDLKFGIIDGGGDGKVFSRGVVGEESVSGER